MSVYTYVKEEAVQQPAYSDEAIALAEAAIEVALNESLLGKTKEKAYEKVVAPARNKLISTLDRRKNDAETRKVDENLRNSMKKHTKELEKALKNYKKDIKGVYVNADGRIDGLTSDQAEELNQITQNIPLQNPAQNINQTTLRRVK